MGITKRELADVLARELRDAEAPIPRWAIELNGRPVAEAQHTTALTCVRQEIRTRLGTGIGDQRDPWEIIAAARKS